MLSIGFTGTRHGMTAAQYAQVRNIVREISGDLPFTAHHGDCIGADAEFDDICATFCGRALVEVHPGPVSDIARQAGRQGVKRHPPTGHMKRNRIIVLASTAVIAAPFEDVEQERGGTWSTIRMARNLGRQLAQLAIVYRDGRVVKERWT